MNALATSPWFLLEIIEAYEGWHPTGGSLHITFDDGNWKRSDIEFCASFAAEHDDFIGEAIAKALLKMPDSLLAQLGDGESMETVFRTWASLQEAEDRAARGITHLTKVIIGNGQNWARIPVRVVEHKSLEEARRDIAERLEAESVLGRRYKLIIASADADQTEIECIIKEPK